MAEAVRHDDAGGFTLIELMVALVVFSLAAMALIRLEGAVIRSTRTLDTTLVAQMVARNIAVEALTDAQPPARGAASGVTDNGGATWQWTRVTEPLGDRGALRISIDVRGEGGQSLGHLVVFRPPAPPPVPAAPRPAS